MPKTIIEAFPKFKKDYDRNNKDNYLFVSELFSKTVQGEGEYVGVPSTFLRLQGCTLNCSFCDTLEVWKTGNPYTIDELLKIFDFEGVTEDLTRGHHLVLTGGSPLKQMEACKNLIDAFEAKNHFSPFIECETECVLAPNLLQYRVSHWNLSPKLENSNMPKSARYKPDVIRRHMELNNYTFKFVVSDEDSWKEIKLDFIDKFNIDPLKIVLMPEGINREQLQSRYDFIVDLACRTGLRVSDRMHISFWDKKTGV
jgi:7-carboxy-7-deazaguanine synthase